MIKFKERKDWNYKIYEADVTNERWTTEMRILKNKNHNFFSVFVKRYVTDDWLSRGYMEVSSNHGTTLPQAKQIAEQLHDIVLWYNPPRWKE